jgi:predicted DNA-binding transcriptional regulator AlpA
MLLNHAGASAIDSLSRTQRERLIKLGLYPKPVRITTHRVGFVADEVRAWALARIVARDSGLPDALDPVLVATAPKPAQQAGAAR